MLPNADGLPAFMPQLTIDAFITGHVVFALAVPELPVGFRAGVALEAAVPAAPAVRLRNVKFQDVAPISPEEAYRAGTCAPIPAARQAVHTFSKHRQDR
mgnify:FL=1